MLFKTGSWKNTHPSGKKGHQRAIAPSLGPPRVPTMMALFLYGQSMMALEGNRSTNSIALCFGAPAEHKVGGN